ncbi:MAG: DUF58 domain-containing protein [Candidatus Promineifilaceae bacterium]|nr:DUF58 domain-containing protein [Candidatus Promineifilaceae bacterium]
MSSLAVLILILLVVGILLRIDFIFYIFYVTSGIYIWSRWVMPRAFRNVRFERTFTDHAFLREVIPVRITLRNEGRVPLPWLQITESVPPELSSGRRPNYALSLGGGERTAFTYKVRATRRGYYRLGPLFVRMGDLFGWQQQNAQSGLSYLTVYPRIIPLSQLGLPSRLPFGTIASNQRLFEDPARPNGVRDYRSGDSLRQINWKVSAHSNQLVVKTLQPAIALDTAIMLNLSAGDYSRRARYSAPEWAIEIAASLAAHLIERKQAVGLATNAQDPLLQLRSAPDAAGAFDAVSGRLLLAGEDAAFVPPPIPPRTGRDHLMKILELLARVEAGRNAPPFASWLPGATVHLSWGATLPVITPTADEALVQALHRLVRAGYNPLLLLVETSIHFGEIRQRARQLGFTAFQVAAQKDLDVLQSPQPAQR